MLSKTKHPQATLALAVALVVTAPAASAAAASYSFFEVNGSGQAIAGGVTGTLVVDLNASGQWQNLQPDTGGLTPFYPNQIQSLTITGGTHTPFTSASTLTYNGGTGWGYVDASSNESLTSTPNISSFSYVTPDGPVPFGAGQSLTAEDKTPPPDGTRGYDDWSQYLYRVILSPTQMIEQYGWTACLGDSCTDFWPSDGAYEALHTISWTPAAVPVPAALPLLASALVGLGAVARRRKA